ncbi:MAG: zinc-dependent peptidase [Gammaproteobacteria bacterium]|nr:zinc-dependent peptidase [Gammaproteobacteria bacterium]
MFWSLKAWRRRRILRREPLPDEVWRCVVARLTFLHGLTADEFARLRAWVVLFLHGKKFSAAGGLAVTDEMRVMITAQACVLILNLDLDYYDDWVEIIVYPGGFVADHEYEDEAGIVHHAHDPLSGESWPRGPVILSWEDVAADELTPGHNVVIHEFAHKLDMRNGEANGFPQLHAAMSQPAWGAAFSTAYADFCLRVDAGKDTGIDAYAAENPAEFFAVMSEAFFTMPHRVQQAYPAVYQQLTLFYRQDPLARLNKQ